MSKKKPLERDNSTITFAEQPKNVMCEGYCMKRIGMGGKATHYWEVRYFVLTNTSLSWYTDHLMQRRKGNIDWTKGSSCVMIFDREKYDEGRRRFVWGVAKTAKSTPTIIDAYNQGQQKMWVDTCVKAGFKHSGKILAKKKNPGSVKEGWMNKKNIIWQTRYMVLLPQMMIYFKWKRDKQPQDVIPFYKNTIVKEGKGEDQFIVVDVVKNQEVQFKCHDKYSRRDWQVAIQGMVSRMDSKLK